MLMHDYGEEIGQGVGLVMTDANKFFTNLRFFMNLY